ncbi:MAG: glycosyltransferase [Balneolaceae bacterium]
MDKTVLLIAYYFPPMGRVGAHRPVKMAKYLQRLGWKPVILAPDTPLFKDLETSLLDEIKELNIPVERVALPGIPGVKRSFMQSDGLQRLIKWVTSWFYFPDNKKGWVEPAVEKALQVIREHDVSIIFSTSPPQSNHLIAASLKEKTGVPVVMDFRDDWLDSHLIRYPTRWHRRRMAHLEQKTLGSADALTVINGAYQDSFRQRHADLNIPVEVVPNGYDAAQFAAAESTDGHDRFVIAYTGSFYEDMQPDTFFRAVRKVMDEDAEFAKAVDLQFAGGLTKRHWEHIRELKLQPILSDFGYVDFEQAVAMMMRADLLFLTLGNWAKGHAVTPSKLFEYMGTRNPILALVPDGITRSMLALYEASYMADVSDTDGAASHIHHAFRQWQLGELPRGNEEFAASFSREEAAKKLSDLMNRLLSNS